MLLPHSIEPVGPCPPPLPWHPPVAGPPLAGAVEVRLRGSDPDFVVTLPAYEASDVATSGSAASPTVIPTGDDERGTSRLNLRLPEGLKARVEESARREGLSLNAWLVRAAAAAVEGTQAQMSWRSPGGSQKYTGWVR